MFWILAGSAAAQRDNVVMQPLGLFGDGNAAEFARTFAVTLGDDSGSFSLRITPQKPQKEPEAEGAKRSSLETEIVREAEKRVKRLLAEIEKSCQLTKEQKEKLVNAAKADAGAFQRDVKRWLVESEAARQSDDTEVTATDKLGARPLLELRNQMRLRIYGGKSIYVKIFDKILSAEQTAAVSEAYLKWFTIQHKRLNAQQRQALMDMLLAAREGVPTGLSRTNYCIEVAGRLPSDKLEAVVGPDESRIIRNGSEIIKP
jgi:hypothetical protein